MLYVQCVIYYHISEQKRRNISKDEKTYSKVDFSFFQLFFSLINYLYPLVAYKLFTVFEAIFPCNPREPKNSPVHLIAFGLYIKVRKDQLKTNGEIA